VGWEGVDSSGNPVRRVDEKVTAAVNVKVEVRVQGNGSFSVFAGESLNVGVTVINVADDTTWYVRVRDSSAFYTGSSEIRYLAHFVYIYNIFTCIICRMKSLRLQKQNLIACNIRVVRKMCEQELRVTSLSCILVCIINHILFIFVETRKDVGAECRHDMRPSAVTGLPLATECIVY